MLRCLAGYPQTDNDNSNNNKENSNSTTRSRPDTHATKTRTRTRAVPKRASSSLSAKHVLGTLELMARSDPPVTPDLQTYELALLALDRAMPTLPEPTKQRTLGTRPEKARDSSPSSNSRTLQNNGSTIQITANAGSNGGDSAVSDGRQREAGTGRSSTSSRIPDQAMELVRGLLLDSDTEGSGSVSLDFAPSVRDED